ncbi:hypothetical protein Emag_001221 [Eimeria magna]
MPKDSMNAALTGPSAVLSHRLNPHAGQLAPPTAPEGVVSTDASAGIDQEAIASADVSTSDENLPQNVPDSDSSASAGGEGSESGVASSHGSLAGVSGQEEDVHQSAAEHLSTGRKQGSLATIRRGLGESSEHNDSSIDESNDEKTASRSVSVGKHSEGDQSSSLSGDNASDKLANPPESLTVLDPDNVPTAAELSELPEQSATDEQQLIKQPVLDTTQYAAFTLKDLGLRGLAAVDNTQEAGAFAVSVGCGYFHDPPEIPGLAHMLEHMIFLGSSTQEEATAWDELISSKGGMHNAHTKPDVTTFYVTAPTLHIPELLGVFLQHLLKPALLPAQVQSEAMAVHYEHEKNIPDLERVALHAALKYLSDSGTAGNAGEPSSPVSAKFGTGSLETLCIKPAQRGINLIESMRRFHRKCYVPSNMSISLRMGRTSQEAKGMTFKLLDVIDLVSASFRKVVNSGSIPSEDDGDDGEAGGDAGDLAKTEKPESPSEAFLQQADKKTDVGATDESSEANGFQKIDAKRSSSRGFITKGEAFKHWTTRSSIFGLVLDLTDQGEEKHDKMMNIIRRFTKEMQETVNESFVSQYYENYKNISQLFWQSQDPLSPLDQVVLSAEASLQYPSRPDLTLSTGVCISTPSQDVLYREVRRLVEAMLPGNEVVVRVIPSNNISQEAALELAEYGVKYTVDPIESASSGGEGELKLPQPLSCKVGQAEVVPHPPPSVCMSFSAGVPKVSADDSTNLLHQRDVASPPCVLLSDDNLTIVWHNGAPFKKPIVRSFVKARLEDEEATALNDAFGKIFTLILADRAKLKLSEYHGCGVDLIVAYTGGSLVFELQGYSHKCHGRGIQFSGCRGALLACLYHQSRIIAGKLHCCFTSVPSEDISYSRLALHSRSSRGVRNFAVADGCSFPLFIGGRLLKEGFFMRVRSRYSLFDALVRLQLKEDVSDFSASTAYELAMDVALSIVRQSRFSQFDLKEQLLSSEFTFENFTGFLNRSIQKTAIDCFFMGDIDATKAKELALEFVETIRTFAIPYDKAAGTKTLNLTSDVEVLLKNPIASDVNNALVSLYISEPPDVLESVLYSTIGEIIRAPFFDTVRTINMDGYVASASVTELAPVTALGTIVQDGFANFFSGFLFHQGRALAAQNFVQCPDALKKYLTRLVLDASRHRLVVKLEAASVNEEEISSVEERQCTLPGYPARNAIGVTPVGVKRTQPSENTTTPRGVGSGRKDLIEQRRKQAETDKKALRALGNEGNLTMQNTSAVSKASSQNSTTPVNTAILDQATQGRGSSIITGVGVTADAELSTHVEGETVADEADDAQYCESEEASFSDRYCTVHEATIRETSACQKPTDARVSQILQEDDDWEQLVNADDEAPKEEKMGDSVPQGEHAPATEVLQTELVDKQQQQARLQPLQEEVPAAWEQKTPGQSTSSIEHLHAQAVATGQQAQLQQLQQTQMLLEAEQRLRALVNSLALLQQQQQQLMQPRVALLRRYGLVPSIVFAASGGAASNMRAGKQLFIEGGAPRSMIGMATTTRLQLKARQLQMLQARRQVVEQQIKDIQRRMLVTAAAEAQAATQA